MRKVTNLIMIIEESSIRCFEKYNYKRMNSEKNKN